MQPPQNKPHKTKFRILSAFTALWFVLLGIAFVQRQAIADFVALRGYEPSAAIAALARDTAMTDNARKVFYVNDPQIVAKTNFTDKCPSALREQTIVLGCYHGNQNGIYLLDVTDQRLKGIVQVTAAHEMLHAYYERLSDSERQRVDAMLRDYYENELDNERIEKTIEGYKKTEPRDVVNEMHSIFATEIADLPDELEAYYTRYFTDRQASVRFATQYEQEFNQRRAAVASGDAQLSDLKRQIDSGEADLRVQQQQIAARRDELNTVRSSGNIDAYNAGVPGYNALVNNYNAGVAKVQGLVTQYNDLVVERNRIAAEIGELSEALSSNVAPIN